LVHNNLSIPNPRVAESVGFSLVNFGYLYLILSEDNVQTLYL